MDQFIKEVFEAIENTLYKTLDIEDKEIFSAFLKSSVAANKTSVGQAGEIVDYFDMPRRGNRSPLAAELVRLKSKHKIEI